MRISDWSSDVGSSDLLAGGGEEQHRRVGGGDEQLPDGVLVLGRHAGPALAAPLLRTEGVQRRALDISAHGHGHDHVLRSEEHTSELQSLMRISYAVFCLKKKRIDHMYQHTQRRSYIYTQKYV